MAFHALGLSDELVRAITAAGYSTPTPIQAQAIPIAITGADMIGCAQTGTGKTAAFVLPMLQRLSLHPSTPHAKKHVRALILTPTRELAKQVEDFIKLYGSFLKLRTLCVYGGIAIHGQLDSLRRGVEIVIATPGRLLDHIDRRSIDLSHVEILVLDEADRMFDMGFINDVRAIIDLMPKERQTLLFSATMPNEVRNLAASVMQHPKTVEIGQRRDPVASVTQKIYRVPKSQKLDLLIHILNNEERDNVLVFSRTKHGADKITTRIERAGIKAVAIHSNRTQAQRQRALDGFKQGLFKVLVATDIAARGIDVEGISHVINFDTPTHAEDYIHRIGRTGRASAIGDALTFVSSEEEDHMRDIERFTGKKLERKTYPGFVPTPQPQAGVRPAEEKTSMSQTSETHPSERQPISNGTPLLDRAERPAQRGREGRPSSRSGGASSGSNRGRPAGPRNSDRPYPPRGSNPRAGSRDGGPRSSGPREGAPRAGGFRDSGPRSSGPREGAPRTGGFRDSGRPPRSNGPRDPRRDGPPRGDRPARFGAPRAGAPRTQSGAPRRRIDDRRNDRPALPSQGQDASSLHLYSKTKPFKKNMPVSRFTGALFNQEDTGFVHPLDKKKKFTWNPFKKKGKDE